MTTSTPTAPAATLDSINPATGDVAGSVRVTPPDEIAAVVARARAAQPGWRDLGAAGRAEMLRPIGPALAERADELGLLMTREMGKPLKESVGEVKHCGETTGATIDEILAAIAPRALEDERTRSVLHRDPFGVCAAIAPWNFPLAMPHWMVLPALVAGNTVVLKPSEETPLIAQAYADILREHLPRDVLQVVHGADDQGKALVAADIDLIAFTGSREVGSKILGAASWGLKRVILELGGKDPLIVLDDADLDEAAKFAVHNSFRNCGQVCVSTERIYVDERVADSFEEKVIGLANELKAGDGTDPDVTMGPMINAAQRDHVVRQVRDAIADGATVALGGEGAEGNFVPPTVLTSVTHEMEIMREETFGPVACIMRFASDDEAVDLANDTPFGLGASVFGGDEARASEVARRLTAGMIGINRGCGGASGSPWVGAKQSGYGYHSGPDGHRQFTQARVVSSAK